MRSPSVRFVGLLAVILSAACSDDPLAHEVRVPDFAISDAAHDGLQGFFFLPPIVPAPSPTGDFDGSLSPVMDICALVATGCVSIATYDRSSGPGGEVIRVSGMDEHYVANWHTDQFELVATTTYRIRVLLEGVELGFADVDVVSGGNELKNVDTGEYVALKDGRTLPVKFRIEQGALLTVDADGGTVRGLDGRVTLRFPSGALDAPITVAMAPASSSPTNPRLVSGSAFTLGPEGARFRKPVDLTISYEGLALPPGTPDALLTVGRVVDGRWVVAGGEADVQMREVKTSIRGFSTWGLLGLSPLSPSAPLIYSSDRDGDPEIFIAGRTSVEEQLTANGEADSNPDWLGRRVVFERGGDIWIVDDDGRNPVNLTNSPEVEGNPGWSPDGIRIVFVRWMGGTDLDVWVMNADGSGATNLTRHPALDAGPAWSPDGGAIAFHSDRDGLLDVFSMLPDGTSPNNLSADPVHHDGSPAWSRDGTRIAWTKFLPGSFGNIWVMDPLGGSVAEVTATAASIAAAPAWSPDGTQLAFEWYADPSANQPDIWALQVDGFEVGPLVETASADRSPGYHPPVWYEDADGDGFGDPTVMYLTPSTPTGAVSDGSDCDDTNPATYPGAPEAPDGQDNDCDGEIDEGLLRYWYDDLDGDGYGDPASAVWASSPPSSGMILTGGDCDDGDPTSYPGAPELADGRDNDCDGQADEGFTWFADTDGDGFGDPTTATPSDPGSGWVLNGDDCDDSDAGVYPGADEIVDGVDNDCDGLVDEGSGGTAGVQLTRYEEETLTGFVETLFLTSVDLSGMGWPYDGAVVEGFLQTAEPGTYELRLEYAPSAAFWLDGALVGSDLSAGSCGPTSVQSFETSLTVTSTPTPFRIEYASGCDTSLQELELLWRPLGGSVWVTVPQENLSR